jgi:hypothetical protein
MSDHNENGARSMAIGFIVAIIVLGIVAIISVMLTLRVVHGQTIIDPIQECAAGASCYYALLPMVTK